MSKEPQTVEMISDGEDLFVVVNGVKVEARAPWHGASQHVGFAWAGMDRARSQLPRGDRGHV
jgi:hypothetical protein